MTPYEIDTQNKRWDTIWYSGPISKIESNAQLKYYLNCHFIYAEDRITEDVNKMFRLQICYPRSYAWWNYDLTHYEDHVWVIRNTARHNYEGSLQHVIFAMIAGSHISLDSCLENRFWKSKH